MSFVVDSVQQLVRATDSAFARTYLTFFKERSSLMTFLFHGLFKNTAEIAANDIDPLERTTVAKFRQLVAYYVNHGYRFVSTDDLLNGLPDGKFATLTFDDGYHNNVRALPVLEEFDVPATFFISTNHVKENKCYWWDVFYRERLAQGTAARSAYHEAIEMKSLKTEQIESDLKSRFGAAALTPRGEIDRPFTPSELRDFARHPNVRIGNHTANHAILLNYPDDEIRQQVNGAQDFLHELTGKRPTAIAYPNGGHDDRIVKICSDAGVKIGFTIRPEKTSVPHDADSAGAMRLGRFCPHDESPMKTQCLTYRSDVALYGRMRAGYLRLARKQIAQ